MKEEAEGIGRNPAASIQVAEERAMDAIFPENQEHLNYLNGAYPLAFAVQSGLEGQRVSDIPDLMRAQFMIVMRITDFLRCIQLLYIKGYYEQAGTLAASVFELAHTALFLEHSPASIRWRSRRSRCPAPSCARQSRTWVSLVGEAKGIAGRC